MRNHERIELQHKALLLVASVIVKTFLMAIASSYVFCGSIDPNIIFLQCGTSNIIYIGGSVAAVAIMGALFGYYIIRLKSFEMIFAKG